MQPPGETEFPPGRSLPCPGAEPGCWVPVPPPNITPLPGGNFNAPYTSEAIKTTVGMKKYPPKKSASLLTPSPARPVETGERGSNLPRPPTLKREWTPPHPPLQVGPGSNSPRVPLQRLVRNDFPPFPSSASLSAAPQRSLVLGSGAIPAPTPLSREKREGPRGKPEGRRAPSRFAAAPSPAPLGEHRRSNSLFIRLSPAPTFIAKQVHSLHTVKRRDRA